MRVHPLTDTGVVHQYRHGAVVKTARRPYSAREVAPMLTRRNETTLSPAVLTSRARQVENGGTDVSSAAVGAASLKPCSKNRRHLVTRRLLGRIAAVTLAGVLGGAG